MAGHAIVVVVARSRKSLATLTLGSSKIKLLTISRLWRYCGPSNYRFNFILYWYAPWVFFEVVNVLSCSPFMFENTENKQLDWTSTGIDADASKGKSWPGYSWQQSGLMLKMWDTGFISTPCHCYLSMINWIMTNLHVVIPMESDGP